MCVSLLGKYYVTNETGINDTYKIYTMDINVSGSGLAFGLFVGKAQTVSKERLIEIADSVYNLPRFADYQIKNGEPVIIEKETIYLTPEELAKIPKSDPFYGCTEPGCKYYIVRYPCDIEVYNTLADLLYHFRVDLSTESLNVENPFFEMSYFHIIFVAFRAKLCRIGNALLSDKI